MVRRLRSQLNLYSTTPADMKSADPEFINGEEFASNLGIKPKPKSTPKKKGIKDLKSKTKTQLIKMIMDSIKHVETLNK